MTQLLASTTDPIAIWRVFGGTAESYFKRVLGGASKIHYTKAGVA
jgi:hypothetical protein